LRAQPRTERAADELRHDPHIVRFHLQYAT
jgi:hypothetical protein